MYEPHGWVKTPVNRNILIWRYLRFDRFVDLLAHRHLHFARFDQFPDRFEGVLSPATVPLAKDRFRNVPIRPGDTLTDFQMLVRDDNRLNKLCSYANCWFMNEHESDGMWRLYAPEGIAVRSTFEQLCASLVYEPKPVHVGAVQYLDYRTQSATNYGNTLASAFDKRKEFEHERELRAVVVMIPAGWTSGSPPYEELRDTHPKGVSITTDLHALIEGVYLAPGRPESFGDQVREAMARYGLDKPVEPSRLDEWPALI